MSLPPLPTPNAKLFSAGALKMFGSFIWLETSLVNKSTVLDTADEGRELSVQLEKPVWGQRGVINISCPATPSFPKLACICLRESKVISSIY